MEVHSVVKKKYAALYQNNPNISKVFYFDKNEKEIIPKLKKEQYDFVVDLQKNLRSLNIKKSLKVPSSSFPKINLQKWLLVNFKIDRLPKVHIVDRYFEAVKKIGVKNDVAGLDFYIPEKDNLDINSVDPMLKNGYIGFVIGGQHFTKILPPEKSAEIIDKLELPIVLLGGNEDFRRGKKIKSLTKNKQIINTCGRYNLNQSASLVKQCSVLITNDTGLMHIGAAFQKPMITIWGNTVPAFGMYPYMPGNKNNYFMAEVNNLSCRPCSKLGYNNCPKKHFRCMLNQNTEIIADKVNEYIALNSQI